MVLKNKMSALTNLASRTSGASAHRVDGYICGNGQAPYCTRTRRSRRGFSRTGFTMLEVLGALAIASIMLVTLTWVQLGGAASYSERVDERRAQYIASVMRQVFEAERGRVLNDYQEHSFLAHMGLNGEATTLPDEQIYDPTDPNGGAAGVAVGLNGNNIDDFEELVPRSGVNFSARREGATSPREIQPTGATLASQGYMPLGHSTGLDPQALGEAAGAPLPLSIYYGRIRPDALVSGLCEPGVSTVNSDGAGASGKCKAETYAHSTGRAGANVFSDTTIDPEFGYVPANNPGAITPLGISMRLTAAVDAGCASVSVVCADQMVFPFLGYYGTQGTSKKVVVTDDTALAIVVKTNFTSAQIPSERVLRRVAELLAPYGGYGLHSDHSSEALAYYACLPHMTDFEGTRNGFCSSTPPNIYKPSNTPTESAIVGGRLAWRYLAKELPLRDAGKTLFSTTDSATPPTPQTATISTAHPLQVQGQLFMVGLFGRRNSVQHALEVASFDALSEEGDGPTLYFSGDGGFVDAPTSEVDSGEVAGRNIGFVFSQDVTIEGDLVVQSDAVIAAPARVLIPDAELDLEGGAFFAGRPHGNVAFRRDEIYPFPNIYVTGGVNGNLPNYDARIRLEFLAD